jgi:hypothetical protein
MNHSSNPATDEALLRELFPVCEDARRCQSVLLKLVRHLNKAMTLTGSLAFGWHSKQQGRKVEGQFFNDIDIVIEGIESVATPLNRDFLVSHFHPTRGRGKILLQLVDVCERVRIDLFTPFSPSLMNRVHQAELCGINCNVIAAEDLTARLLAIACEVTTGSAVDPKYYDKFRCLSELVDLNIVRDIWSDYRKPDSPRRFDAAAEAVHRTITQTPDLLRTEVYDQPGDAACPWCCASEVFSVSPPADIFAVLGYV